LAGRFDYRGSQAGSAIASDTKHGPGDAYGGDYFAGAVAHGSADTAQSFFTFLVVDGVSTAADGLDFLAKIFV
jgi:hypothetical protein